MANKTIEASSTAEGRTMLPFQPNPFQLDKMPLFQNEDPPRFLFRIHTPNCFGVSSLSEITSQAFRVGGSCATRDIFKLQQEHAARILNTHLRWWDHEKASECNLVCWTSSLLFALQYGFHRARQDNPENCQPSQICLLVLDTRGFCRGTFVKDLEIIDVFSPYADKCQEKNLEYLRTMRRGTRGYYFGEYLSQGYLNIQGQCAQTNIQELIDSGLFDLMPEFEDRSLWTEWANRVLKLREPFKSAQPIANSVHREVRTAITIAERCFDGQWPLPVAVMLLALKPRTENDALILEGFASMYSST